jgi:hypothetical protein
MSTETVRVALKSNGKYLGCDPTARPGVSGDAAFPVYADRDVRGGWETGELTKLNDRQFAVRLVEANRQLTITDDSRLESRPAGAIGGWEQFYATEQPDGSNLLYRFGADGRLLLVLTVELL